ncbi:MAG: quinol monooxygenase YgiN [Psychromonas sp.]|jgi:quinol monooxygenase YgiN|uniref:putative quinol monooxygenase n=1 Tax=Psychromonas sp. TaxID=1884585 RepID=UPI0039E5EFFB
MAFTQVIKFNVKPEFKDQFKQALLINKHSSVQEPGSLAMRIYQDNSTQIHFLPMTDGPTRLRHKATCSNLIHKS